MKLPDKREVGSSTLPRPINLRSLPRKRLGAGGVFLFCAGLVRGVRAAIARYNRKHGLSPVPVPDVLLLEVRGWVS
jgi:hypothetical protein